MKSDKLIRQDDLNFETPLDLIEGTIVPSDLFYIRSHKPFPDVQASDWTLRLDGLVERPLELTLDDLKQLPTRVIEMWLECAGNSRARFEPTAIGGQWGDGAVGNAEFTGVALAEILRKAGGVKSGAVDVVVSASDGYQRGMSVELAINPDVLLVWEMNGEPLPGPNGYPVRLVVPNWAGVASVKWLTHIEIIDEAFEGHYNTSEYIIIDEQDQVIRPVREMPVKSIIVAPKDGAKVPNQTQTLHGFAWSGHGAIVKVEVSTDEGQSWNEAKLIPGGGRHAWTRWEYAWTPGGPGLVTLSSQATDKQGNVQPARVPWNKLGYEMHAIEVRMIEVT